MFVIISYVVGEDAVCVCACYSWPRAVLGFRLNALVGSGTQKTFCYYVNTVSKNVV